MASEYTVPDDVLVAETHEYVRPLDDERVRVGITEYAANQLGDIVFVELPEIGQTLDQGESFGTIESVKAASDLYMPVTGEVVAINSPLAEEPDVINDDPFDGGWIVEIALSKSDELEQLMKPHQYVKFLEEST